MHASKCRDVVKHPGCKLGSPSQSPGELVKQIPGVHPEDFDTISLWRGQRICYLKSAPAVSDTPLGTSPVSLFGIEWQLMAKLGPRIPHL